MAKKEQSGLKRKEIFSYFEGVNSIVGDNLFKKGEMSLALNARSETLGIIFKRGGTRTLGNDIVTTENLGIFFYNETVSGTNKGFYRISTVGGITSVYYLNDSNVWTALTLKGANLSAEQFSVTFAEGCCFLVNGTDNNKYISDNGTTVTDSDTATGHLKNSPKAKKIKYYKNHLYLADYTVGSARKKNGIMRSSLLLGIVALVDGDPTLPLTELDVTDTKYVNDTDTLDVYRGNEKVGVLTVTAKTEIKLTATIVYEAGYSDVLSSDELWVVNTYNANKIFRWANNEAGGISVKEYDTFNLGGNLDSKIKLFETIGDVLMIGTNDNLAIWDDYRIRNFDLGIGCVSGKGYVKSLGSLFFLGYGGIFQTSGGQPKLISAKVEKCIEGATKAGLEAAAMGKKGYSILCAIPGDITLYNADGSIDMTLSDVVLEFNIRTTNWYIHTGIKATEFATYISSDDVDRLEFTSTETNYKIMELFNGETDDNSGDANEILFRIDSSNISLSKEFEKISYIHEIIIESERGSNIQCFISLDKEPFYEIEGTAKKGATILKVTNKDGDRTKPPRCRIIKLSIRDYSKQLCKISRVALTFNASNEEEQQRS